MRHVFGGRGLPLVGAKLMIIKQKTWESVSVAVLRSEASRGCPSIVGRQRAEAHARICATTMRPDASLPRRLTGCRVILHKPRASTRCSILVYR